MLTKRSIAPAILLSAILVSACGDANPSAPSRPSAPPNQVPPPPTPPTQVLGRWSVSALEAVASGDKCAAEAVQSVIGAPKPYSITLTETGSAVSVTVTGTSGDYDCTFTPVTADSRGFTTHGTSATYTCRTDFVVKGFRCSDGTLVDLITFGQDVSASISGDEISGKWEISWVDNRIFGSDMNLETAMAFTGRRQ